MKDPAKSSELKRKNEEPALDLHLDELKAILLDLASKDPKIANYFENMTKEDELKFALGMKKVLDTAIKAEVEKKLKTDRKEEQKSNIPLKK